MAERIRIPSNLVPKPHVSSRVTRRSRLWWQDIGRSLMAFTEVEMLVLDWAVILSGEREWWKTHSSEDLKIRLPLLRRALRSAGQHSLPADLRARIDVVLDDLQALTDLRNDLAHMRLCYGIAPTNGDDDDWIPDASHVRVIARRNGKPVAHTRDQKWIRSIAAQAIRTTANLQDVMMEARRLLLERRRQSS